MLQNSVHSKYRILRPVWCLEHDGGTTSLQSYAASTGFRCGKGSFSRLRSWYGKASMASHLHICKKPACRWRKFKDVLGSGQHRLAVSTCQEYRRRWASAASPSMGPQCGTACHQHCMTAACHWTRSRGGWRRISCLDSHECHPVPLWYFCVIMAPNVNVMTYLLTSCQNHPVHLN